MISWPKAVTDKEGLRHQFHHVIDIVPTILEATGIPAPEVVDGIKQAPIEGVSMLYTFDAKNANAPSTHRTQYFEMMGDRAIYQDGWMAVTKVMRTPSGVTTLPKPPVFAQRATQRSRVAIPLRASTRGILAKAGESVTRGGRIAEAKGYLLLKT